MCKVIDNILWHIISFLDSGRGIQFKILLIPGYCSLFGHQNVFDWKKMKLIGNKS
jgi:hypothetical protein